MKVRKKTAGEADCLPHFVLELELPNVGRVSTYTFWEKKLTKEPLGFNISKKDPPPPNKIHIEKI